jgi:hypothetical protein
LKWHICDMRRADDWEMRRIVAGERRNEQRGE